MSKDGRLLIYLGFKGMLYIELELRGAARDVHSGFAPIVPNPVWRMAELLTLLKDPESGRVLVPGFYDGIADLGYDVDRYLEQAPVDEDELLRELGLRSFLGNLRGLELRRALYLQPSLNVSGLYAGYTGRGAKTIVPSRVVAKIDIRPVPGQEPSRLLERLRSYLREKGFGDVEVRVLSSYPAGYTRPSESIVRESAAAAREVYDIEPALVPLSAGSGPIYIFTELLHIPMTGAGVGYYGSRVHAPNENIRLEDFARGIIHVALTLYRFANASGSSKG